MKTGQKISKMFMVFLVFVRISSNFNSFNIPFTFDFFTIINFSLSTILIVWKCIKCKLFNAPVLVYFNVQPPANLCFVQVDIQPICKTADLTTFVYFFMFLVKVFEVFEKRMQATKDLEPFFCRIRFFRFTFC